MGRVKKKVRVMGMAGDGVLGRGLVWGSRKRTWQGVERRIEVECGIDDRGRVWEVGRDRIWVELGFRSVEIVYVVLGCV